MYVAKPPSRRSEGTLIHAWVAAAVRAFARSGRQKRSSWGRADGRRSIFLYRQVGKGGKENRSISPLLPTDGAGRRDTRQQQQDYLSPSQVPKFQACQIPFFLLSPPSLALDCCLASFSPCSLGVPFPSSTCGPSPLIHPPIVPLKRRRERIRACIGTSDDGYATAKVTCIKETLCTQRNGKKGLLILFLSSGLLKWNMVFLVFS